jgi:hypothetical protein
LLATTKKRVSYQLLLLSDAAAAAVPVVGGAHLTLDDWSGGGDGNSIRDGSGSDHMGLEKLNMFKN